MKLLENNQVREISLEEEVRLGLSSTPKYLPSKFFYDERGDELFRKIMQLDEYYPTDCELEIFREHKSNLCSQFGGAPGFDLVELGAGDGYKTKVLLEEILKSYSDFRYIPVDISPNILVHLRKDLENQFPDLIVEERAMEYFDALSGLQSDSNRKKVVLFLGANIGNFQRDSVLRFLHSLAKNLNQDDQALIGFDLRKDPRVIRTAYDDSEGITKEFNLNLLNRINAELDADFSLENFQHYASYDPQTGEAKSFLVSEKEQTVRIGALAESFHFSAWEPIHTETSRKFCLDEIHELANNTGFRVVENFMDEKGYFTDSLWSLEGQS